MRVRRGDVGDGGVVGRFKSVDMLRFVIVRLPSVSGFTVGVELVKIYKKYVRFCLCHKCVSQCCLQHNVSVVLEAVGSTSLVAVKSRCATTTPRIPPTNELSNSYIGSLFQCVQSILQAPLPHDSTFATLSWPAYSPCCFTPVPLSS